VSRILFGDPDAIEDELATADSRDHLWIAAHAARSLVRTVDVSPTETISAILFTMTQARRSTAVTQKMVDDLSRQIGVVLATDARRRRLRDAVDELVRTRRDDLPRLAEALDVLLAEGLPADPVEDVLWTNFAIGAVQAHGA